MEKLNLLSHNNHCVKWYVWYNSPAETLEGDVFLDEEGSDGEEDEDFYPDNCQWEQEEEPVKPGPTAVITEKVTLIMFPSTYFYAHFGLSHKTNAEWKRQDAHKLKTYAHICVGYMFDLIRTNAHKLRWKHIYRINSSMRIEKVMWLCAMRRDNLTNQRTDLVHSIYMLLWSFWKAWRKSVVKVFLYNCLTRQQASSSESNNRIYCVSSTHTEVHVNYVIYENSYILWLLLYS